MFALTLTDWQTQSTDLINHLNSGGEGYKMRSDDYCTPKELSHQVTCYNCQRPAKKQTKTFTGTKPGERYIGNLEIMKETPRRATDGKIYYETVCWTNKFIMKFGNFCSVKCGLIWANHLIEDRRNKRRCPPVTIGDAMNDDTKEKLESLKTAMIHGK